MSKRKSIMELLFVTFNKKDTDKVNDLIKNYTSLFSFISTFGSLDSPYDFWNFNITTQQSLAAIIPKAKTKEILSSLEAVLNLKEKHQGVAFTIPFDSASSNLVKIIEKGETKWKQQ